MTLVLRSLRERRVPQAANERKSPVPPGWPGSEPEYRVFIALMRTGRRHPVDFQYEPRPDGRAFRITGDVIPDFVVTSPHIAIQIQSRYYHGGTAEQRSVDQYARSVLEGRGIPVYFISEDQANTRASYYVRLALIGLGSTDPLGVLTA